MTGSLVRPQQRHTRQHPCPVCGGADQDARGKGKRCHGFTSEDGAWVMCAREDAAGGIAPDRNGLFHHWMGARCGCGTEHELGPAHRESSDRNGVIRRVAALYDYQSDDGEVSFQVVRYDPKGFSQRRPDGEGGWINNLDGVERVLYRLPELKGRWDEVVVITEGEKDADRLLGEGFLATTNPMGAGKWQSAYSESLRDRNVAVIPDNDEVGVQHARDVARSLRGAAAAVAVIDLPEVLPGSDVSNWLDAGHTDEELRGLVTTAFETSQQSAKGAPGDSEDAPSQPTRKAARQRLVEYAEADGTVLFHDPLGHYYAHVSIDRHREVIDLDNPQAGHWLTDLFGVHEHGRIPDRDAVREALDVLKAHARRGEMRAVYTRVGPLPDGLGLALDLGDDEWRAAVVRAGTWAIEPHPVMFRRGKKAAAIPVPAVGGDLSLLKSLLNVSDDRTYRLVVGFLLGCLNPKGVYSGLMLTGGAGAAKTTAARFVRRIIDPTERMAEVTSMPKKQDSFGAMARGSWVPAFDNISSLSPEQSDWLAQLATGYSTSDRTLYSNADEYVISVTRPFIINGIDTADRGDLLSRVTTIELPIIDSYSTFDSLYEAFDQHWPDILGGLLDVAAAAVAVEPSLPTTGWSVRSADHVRWVTAGEEALRWEPRSYEAMVYEENQRAQAAALDALPWASSLIGFLKRNGDSWIGTMGDLLDGLRTEATPAGGSLDNFGWPRSAKGMSDAARRATAGLRTVGIRYTEVHGSRRDGRRYEWRLDRSGGDDGDGPFSPVRGEEEKGRDRGNSTETESPATYVNGTSPPSPPSAPRYGADVLPVDDEVESRRPLCAADPDLYRQHFPGWQHVPGTVADWMCIICDGAGFGGIDGAPLWGDAGPDGQITPHA